MSGSIGDGIEDILNMRRGKHASIQDLNIQLIRDSVPTIVAFTKFDQAVALEGGSSARSGARTRFEQSCRSLFRREPRDVPAEMVSGSYALFCGIAL
jgi:hypothetical protein